MDELTELTDDTFYNIDKPNKYIIYFTAEWCGPCKSIYPFLCKLNEKSSDFKIYKIDVDSNESLVKKYNIKSMPTFIFMIDDKNICETCGADKNKLSENIIKYFKISNNIKK
tara:strand:- start:216 stop:551 length:336 start_codon:yes stop_codon:yes gene_type:complete